MSDSPASRPKRSSAFASFYIDEDDFEDDSGSNFNRLKKTVKEEVFVAEKYKSSDTDSNESEVENFELKPAAKVKTKPIKKQNSSKSNIPQKSKSTITKNLVKSLPKPKNTEEEDFELIVDSDNSIDCRSKPSKSENSEDENFEEEKNYEKLKSKPTIKKAKLLSQTKSTVSLKPKANNLSDQPKLSSTIEKVKIPGQWSGPRRVGLSKSAPTRPLSPVRLKKFD